MQYRLDFYVSPPRLNMLFAARRQLVRLKRDVANDTSHSLRTPIRDQHTHIRGASDNITLLVNLDVGGEQWTIINLTDQTISSVDSGFVGTINTLLPLYLSGCNLSSMKRLFVRHLRCSCDLSARSLGPRSFILVR